VLASAGLDQLRDAFAAGCARLSGNTMRGDIRGNRASKIAARLVSIIAPFACSLRIRTGEDGDSPHRFAQRYAEINAFAQEARVSGKVAIRS
jgi:hypothetical protein